MKYVLISAALLLGLRRGATGSGAEAGRSGGGRGEGARRRRCAARIEGPRHQGRRQVLGAGAIAWCRAASRASSGRRDLRHHLGPRQGHGAHAWDRDQQISAARRKLKYTETVLPTLGFVTDGKGSQRDVEHPRRRASARARSGLAPLLLKAMDNPGNVRAAGPSSLGAAVAAGRLVSPTAGRLFIILFDPQDPSAGRDPHARRRQHRRRFELRSRAERLEGGRRRADRPLAVLSDQRHRGGAAQLSGGRRRTRRSRPMRSPFPTRSRRPPSRRPPATCPINGSAPAVPDALPRQRRVIYPDGGGFKLVELAPNVQHVQGGSANNLIVAMKDYLVIFDAPYGELQSRWTIDAAKAKYPGKPIRYLVLTHHHMDHTGGMRTYVAEGANRHRSESATRRISRRMSSAAHRRSGRAAEEAASRRESTT